MFALQNSVVIINGFVVPFQDSFVIFQNSVVALKLRCHLLSQCFNVPLSPFKTQLSSLMAPLSPSRLFGYLSKLSCRPEAPLSPFKPMFQCSVVALQNSVVIINDFVVPFQDSLVTSQNSVVALKLCFPLESQCFKAPLSPLKTQLSSLILFIPFEVL